MKPSSFGQKRRVTHTALKGQRFNLCAFHEVCLRRSSDFPVFFRVLGALPIVYTTLLCYPFIRTVALLVYILLSSHAIYCAVTARSSVRRLRSFAWQALFRFSFFLLRWVGVGGGSPTSLRHFLTMDALAVLGGVINITRIPERFWPGLFDYWCNSHQIMHVLVVISILYLHWGVLDDLLWITSYDCPSD